MRKKMIFISCMAVLLLSSCASRKGIAYLQDMELGQRYLYDARYEATVHRNDRLSITVNCKRPELGADGNVSTSSGEVSAESAKGYRVDVEGNIDFPILGKLHVEGLKVSEVTDLIKNRIIQGNYIKDPQVSLEFLNFKYTVLGAVGRTGTFTVKDDRITLLEAIANAGDLSSKAKINSVAVIREIDGICGAQIS